MTQAGVPGLGYFTEPEGYNGTTAGTLELLRLCLYSDETPHTLRHGKGGIRDS